jgi:hypothetical protein
MQLPKQAQPVIRNANAAEPTKNTAKSTESNGVHPSGLKLKCDSKGNCTAEFEIQF